ncbi:MAG: CHAT domain-containing protein [Gloeomargarita sp. HHBFW_bins_205]
MLSGPWLRLAVVSLLGSGVWVWCPVSLGQPPATPPSQGQPRAELVEHLAEQIYQQISQLEEQGNLAAAISLAEYLAVLLYRNLGGSHPLLADALNLIGRLQTEQGNYAAALPLYQRALAIREEILGPEHPEVAFTLNNLANLYRIQGNHQAALPLLQRALAIAEKSLGPRHPEVAITLNNLALLQAEQQNYPQALSLYQRALTILTQAFGESDPYVATVLTNLGTLHQARRDTATALALLQRALAIRLQILPSDHLDIANSLNNLAALYYDQRDYSAALPLYQQSLALVQSRLGTTHPIVATVLTNLALVYWQQGDLNQTLALLKQVQDIEEHNLRQNLVVGSEAYKRNYMTTFRDTTDAVISLHLQVLPASAEATHLALTTVLRRKGRLLDFLSQNQARLQRQLAAAEQAKLQQLSQLRTRIARLVFDPVTAPDPSLVSQLRQEADQLEAELSLRSAAFRELTQPVTVRDVQRWIPTDAALVEFIRYRPYNLQTNRFDEPRYGVYVLRATGQPQGKDLGLAVDIDAQVRQAYLRLADPRSPKEALQQAAQALAARLITPIRSWLGQATHLLISPDGELNRIPFPALVDSKGQYLLESYLITLLTSGRELLRMTSPPGAATAPLIVADPSFGDPPQQSFASPSWANIGLPDGFHLTFTPLPGTAQEAQAIKALLPTARLLTRTAATESVVKAATAPQVLHLATHGFFLANWSSKGPWENPLLRSGLALAGVNQRHSTSPADDDGVLTALEVTSMHLHGTALVVLSACDTGRGEVVNGEGVYGLRRAFTLAGARSQVSTLWKVDDQATRDIMVAFYQNLRRGLGITEALRQVQRERSKRESPYYWAAFVASGDWSPLPWRRP